MEERMRGRDEAGEQERVFQSTNSTSHRRAASSSGGIFLNGNRESISSFQRNASVGVM